MTRSSLLSVRDLCVNMRSATRGGAGPVPVVQDVSLDVPPGGALGLVGESGSGKTTTLRAILRLLPAAARITGGRVMFDGQDLARAADRQLRGIRGGQIGVIWQDPLACLDPVMRVGEQIAEAVRAHQPVSRAAARIRALDLMRQVELPDVNRICRRYPHELSGGQRQRVVIATAVAASPRLLLADEPTTALDVTVQDQVLTLIARLRAELSLALLLVTHDLAVVAQTCDRVAVMYAGRIVETGPVSSVFGAPRHHYTRGLLRAAPSLDQPGVLPEGIAGTPAASAAAVGCAFAPRCAHADEVCLTATPVLSGATEHLAACYHPVPWAGPSAARAAARRPRGGRAGTRRRPVTGQASGACAGPVLEVRNLSVTYPARARRGPAMNAVCQVSLQLARSEVLGLVGESGCGKSSLARALVGLEPATGEIVLDGRPLPARRTRDQARRVQIVFQDPYASLNPRLTVRHAVEEMLRVHRLRPAAQVPGRASELLHLVGLPSQVFDARPAALSGGQRQRVAIARALALEPDVLVADEPTTALDVSVQAVILGLFARLRDDLGLALLLITHNLAVVSAMCDRIAVMYLGQIIEQAPARVLLADPRHPYTRRLLAAVPRLGPGHAARPAALRGDPPGLVQVPSGCVFHPRCPEATAHCSATAPMLTYGPAGPDDSGDAAHLAACHYAWPPTRAVAGNWAVGPASGDPVDRQADG